MFSIEGSGQIPINNATFNIDCVSGSIMNLSDIFGSVGVSTEEAAESFGELAKLYGDGSGLIIDPINIDLTPDPNITYTYTTTGNQPQTIGCQICFEKKDHMVGTEMGSVCLDCIDKYKEQKMGKKKLPRRGPRKVIVRKDDE